MNSIEFPNMFESGTTKVLKEYDATMECIYLLFHSECGEMFGDPDFGVRLRRYIFDQNNYILRDILIDELYTKITTFCPQLILTRKDISIESIGNKLIGHITCRNDRNFQPNTYDIVLFKGDEF